MSNIINRRIPNFAIAARPTRLEDFCGNTEVLTQLVNLHCNSPHAPAIALYGGTGTGKTSMSRYLGARTACLRPNGTSADPCGECPVCNAIFCNRDVWGADPWPNARYYEVDVSNLTNVEREKMIDYAPPPRYDGNRLWKSMIVLDEFQGADRKLQNKLLKDVEDRGDQISFVIVSSEPENILPAMKSRCIPFHLAAPKKEDLMKLFQRMVAIGRRDFDSNFAYDPAAMQAFVGIHLDSKALPHSPPGYRTMAQNFTAWVSALGENESLLTVENLTSTIRRFTA
jgi:DNA polymerase-3 subunit gamma/tau